MHTCTYGIQLPNSSQPCFVQVALHPILFCIDLILIAPNLPMTGVWIYECDLFSIGINQSLLDTILFPTERSQVCSIRFSSITR